MTAASDCSLLPPYVRFRPEADAAVVTPPGRLETAAILDAYAGQIRSCSGSFSARSSNDCHDAFEVMYVAAIVTKCCALHCDGRRVR